MFDAISYTNALPPWVDSLTIDYPARTDAVLRRIEAYLDGKKVPSTPFKIVVPRRNGIKRPWVIPSIDDQIVVQTAVSSFADSIAARVQKHPVFSYRYNKDPNRVLLTASQIDAWSRFKAETDARLRAKKYLLQLDLERAFESIERGRFLAFLEDVAPRTVGAQLLRLLLTSFVEPTGGLPLVNDSIFFLGNAYLTVVDAIFTRHSADYIRFVDDYRIFGSSRDSLEGMLRNVRHDLGEVGFRLAESKIKLGSSEEYFDAIARAKHAKEEEGQYLSTAIFEETVSPKEMVELVARAIADPESYLNEGYGRLTLGAVRRMRVDALVVGRKKQGFARRSEFRNLLSQNTALVSTLVDLARKYAAASDESWRTVWILYIMNDIDLTEIKERKVAAAVKEVVAAIRTELSRPMVARLWAGMLWRDESEAVSNADRGWYDLDYLDAGTRCCGGRVSA